MVQKGFAMRRAQYPYELRSLTNPLTDDQIRRVTPSVFAAEPWERVSSKYVFIPTSAVIEKLRTEGFYPFHVQQSRARIDGKLNYTKHMVRFRPLDWKSRVKPGTHTFITDGAVFPEIVLTNAHDGGAGYSVELGLFRLICFNGAVTAVGSLGRIYTKHIGDQVGQVIDATYRIIDEVPLLGETVKALQSRTLSLLEQRELAARAAGLRWKAEDVPFPAEQLLSTRRSEDKKADAFTVFNVIQENLIKGQRYYGTNEHGSLRRYQTREVHGVDSDLDINRGLWSLVKELVHA